MRSSFKKILIPVDFSINTKVAIKNAMLMADKNATLHLLYVQTYGYPFLSFDAYRFLWPDEKKDYLLAQQKLEKIKEDLQIKNPGLLIEIQIDNKHDVQQAIINTCLKIDADLLVISRRKKNPWFSCFHTIRPEKIAVKTGKAVLLCRPGSSTGLGQNILMPVNERVEEHKLQMIDAVSAVKNIRTCLLAFAGQFTRTNASNTLSIYYQRIRLDKKLAAESKVIPGKFKVSQLLPIAQNLNTDLMILHPGCETKMNFMGGHIFDYIEPKSHLQVLLVS